MGTAAFLLAWLVPWRAAFRIRANKSQEEVASEANMTQSEVSKIESGKSFNPTLDRIQMLCKVFNVTPGYILD